MDTVGGAIMTKDPKPTEDHYKKAGMLENTLIDGNYIDFHSGGFCLGVTHIIARALAAARSEALEEAAGLFDKNALNFRDAAARSASANPSSKHALEEVADASEEWASIIRSLIDRPTND